MHNEQLGPISDDNPRIKPNCVFCQTSVWFASHCIIFSWWRDLRYKKGYFASKFNVSFRPKRWIGTKANRFECESAKVFCKTTGIKINFATLADHLHEGIFNQTKILSESPYVLRDCQFYEIFVKVTFFLAKNKRILQLRVSWKQALGKRCSEAFASSLAVFNR